MTWGRPNMLELAIAFCHLPTALSTRKLSKILKKKWKSITCQLTRLTIRDFKNGRRKIWTRTYLFGSHSFWRPFIGLGARNDVSLEKCSHKDCTLHWRQVWKFDKSGQKCSCLQIWLQNYKYWCNWPRNTQIVNLLGDENGCTRRERFDWNKWSSFGFDQIHTWNWEEFHNFIRTLQSCNLLPHDAGLKINCGPNVQRKAKNANLVYRRWS